MRGWLVIGLVFVGCASQQRVARAPLPPRIAALDEVLARAEQSPCVAGLHAVPASVVELGVFKDVPYQSFSNGNVELNAYGDPGDLVGLEAGSRNEDPALQQCLISFIAAQALTGADQQRVLRFTPAPALDAQPGLTVEVTPRTAPDAATPGGSPSSAPSPSRRRRPPPRSWPPSRNRRPSGRRRPPRTTGARRGCTCGTRPTGSRRRGCTCRASPAARGCTSTGRSAPAEPKGAC